MTFLSIFSPRSLMDWTELFEMRFVLDYLSLVNFLVPILTFFKGDFDYLFFLDL